MKYLKLFNNHSEYVAYSASTSLSVPNVSWCRLEDEVHYINEAIEPYEDKYLNLKILTSGNIRWNAYGSGYNKVIQYSLNNGEWTSITAGSSTVISVNANDTIRLKGENTSYAGSNKSYAGFDSGCTATFNVEGNITSLIYGDNFTRDSELGSGSYNFCSLFKQSNVVSAENLILPTNTLDYCYRAMFSNCSLLAKAPNLPAERLAKGCYWYMFEKCAITTAPDLVAANLVNECYGHMFDGCSNLNYIKCLASYGHTTMYKPLENWTSGVSSTGTFVKDANTTWQSGASGIPNNWTIVDNEE